MKSRVGQAQLGVINFIQCFAKMDEHQIALVTQERKRRGRLFFVLLHSREHRRRSVNNLLLIRSAESTPGRPAKTEHLVENVGAVEGERNRRDMSRAISLFLSFHRNE